MAVKDDGDAEYVRVVVKGAPEYVMPMCITTLNGNG